MCGIIYLNNYRPQVLTFGNITTNRVERFFLIVKNFMKNSTTTSLKRLHVDQTLMSLIEVLRFKTDSCSYNDYVNETKTLIMHDFPLPSYASTVGTTYTLYAATVIKSHCQLFSDEILHSQQDRNNSWTVTNFAKNTEYIVHDYDNKFECTCYVNSSFGIVCRHIMSIRQSTGVSLIQPSDTLLRWHRKKTVLDSSTNCIMVPRDLIIQAKTGVPDEYLNEADTIRLCNRSNANRYKTLKETAADVVSIATQYGGTQYDSIQTCLTTMVDQMKNGICPTITTQFGGTVSITFPTWQTGNTLFSPNELNHAEITTHKITPDFYIPSGIKPKGRPSQPKKHRKFNKLK